MRRRLQPLRRRIQCISVNVFIIIILILLLNTSYTSILGNQRYNNFCLADDDVVGEDEDFLAEILAEQAREEEELSTLEAEAREFDAMKARQPSGGSKMPGYGGSKTKMGNMGGTMPNTNFSKLEEDLKKKEAQQNANAKSATPDDNKISEQEAERIRIKREAAFEAELKKMNEEQRKKAQKQKSKDAKVVKRILKAHKSGKHYAVLGIHNFEVQLGPYYIFNYTLGPIILFRVKTKQIKKVYRNLARTVHPDKNKDGRAVEAFHALETSAAILTDDKQRSDYDKRIIATRRRRNRYAKEKVVGVCEYSWNRSVRTLRVAKKVLGPFSTPILVVGALII